MGKNNQIVTDERDNEIYTVGCLKLLWADDDDCRLCLVEMLTTSFNSIQTIHQCTCVTYFSGDQTEFRDMWIYDNLLHNLCQFPEIRLEVFTFVVTELTLLPRGQLHQRFEDLKYCMTVREYDMIQHEVFLPVLMLGFSLGLFADFSRTGRG